MILHHGTTRQRADGIVRRGPDLDYREKHGLIGEDGFSMADPDEPTWNRTPEEYARFKAASFSDEGGPVVLEVDVPDEIARLAHIPGAEYRFAWGYGLEELLENWAELPKRIIEP